MNLQSIDDPRAAQVLNSMVMELGELETATGRIRAQLDTLLAMLAVEPSAADDAEQAEHQASTSPSAEEEFVVQIEPEQAEDSQTSAAVIGLCARIEASVAEFAAAAEVAHATVDGEESGEPMLEVLVVADSDEHEPAAVVAASVVVINAVDEVVAGSDEPILSEADTAAGEKPALAEISDDQPVAGVADIDAGAVPTAASIAVVDEVAAVAAEGAAPANKVVVLEIKRRVWPQRLAACASVLLIAAAAVVVVVAMPEMVGNTI